MFVQRPSSLTSCGQSREKGPPTQPCVATCVKAPLLAASDTIANRAAACLGPVPHACSMHRYTSVPYVWGNAVSSCACGGGGGGGSRCRTPAVTHTPCPPARGGCPPLAPAHTKRRRMPLMHAPFCGAWPMRPRGRARLRFGAQDLPPAAGSRLAVPGRRQSRRRPPARAAATESGRAGREGHVAGGRGSEAKQAALAATAITILLLDACMHACMRARTAAAPCIDV